MMQNQQEHHLVDGRTKEVSNEVKWRRYALFCEIEVSTYSLEKPVFSPSAVKTKTRFSSEDCYLLLIC